MASKQFGDSKILAWMAFVVGSLGIGIGGISAIIDLNGTANKGPIVIGALILIVLIAGFFVFTMKSISERHKPSDAR